MGAVEQGTKAAATNDDQQTQAPWYAEHVKDDADLKGWLDLKKPENPSALIKMARETERFVGAPKDRLLTLPDPVTGKPEDWNPVYDRLGRPKTPEEYNLKVPEGDDGTFAKEMAPILHKHGISATQAAGLNADFVGLIQSKVAAQAEADKAEYDAKVQTDLNALKKEWPGEVYNQRVELGRRAAREFGVSAEQFDAIEKTMGTAGTLKLFASIGERVGEHTFVTGDGGKGTFGMTPEAASVKKEQLMADAKFRDGYLKNGRKGQEWAQIDALDRIIAAGANV